MIIIGVDFHPEFQQIAWVDTDSGEFQEQRLQHREEAEGFTVNWRREQTRCGSGWKRAAMPAGWNAYWPNCSWNCGSGTRPRSEPNRHYRNFAPFVRQTGERKAQTCAKAMLQQLRSDQALRCGSWRSPHIEM